MSLVLLFDRSKSMDEVATQTFSAIKAAISKPEWRNLRCDISYVARGFYASRPGTGDLLDGGVPAQRLEWFPPCAGGGDCTNLDVFEQFNEQTDGEPASFLLRLSAATREPEPGLNRLNTPLAEAIRWAAQHPWPGEAATGISVLLLATDGTPEYGVRFPASKKPGLCKAPGVCCAPHDVLVKDLRSAWLEARRQFSDIFVIEPSSRLYTSRRQWAGSDIEFLTSELTGSEVLQQGEKPPATTPSDCRGNFWKSSSPSHFAAGDVDPKALRAQLTRYTVDDSNKAMTGLSEKFSELLKKTCERSRCCTEEVCDGKDNDCDNLVDEPPCPVCEAEPTGFPEIVAVGQQGRYGCSGVVMSPHAVLTARHCLPADTVLFGESIHDAAKLRRAVRVHLPEEPPADVAVLELEASLDVRLPHWRQSGDVTPPTSSLSHVGFGASTPDGELGFGYKHALALDGRGWGCDREHALELGCDPDFEMFVPGSPGRDTCQGDSGGALYESVPQVPACVDDVSRIRALRRRLIGLTSRTTSSATVACGQGGIYTRFDQIAPWLEPVLEGIRKRHAAQGGDAR